ncbi:DUF3626 domain-containing protein [Rhodococcus sp. WAY2]|uniref:DUF3626 domain-containing protein n=1 Tax=Rhodococcus sp. WAY2 TaxID=2663121 RepID=UPI0013201E02|nr:hypothetical protein GFS60_07021 [Rhodococcus sp. WAY2]
MPVDTSPGATAVAHARRLAKGVPLDRTLRVTLHFHPDLPFAGSSTLQAIADRGAYLSQFETQTGNGGLTAHPGGDKWNWESRIFGGAYDEHPPSQRPRYGSLNYRADPYGGSPRFGSSYFLLAEHTLDRTTFCFPDSVFEPELFGTADAMNLMEAAAAVEFDDPLDDYIEAHVHGTIDIASDVEALVLDPSYRHTPFDEIARRSPARYCGTTDTRWMSRRLRIIPTTGGRTSSTWPETSHTRASLPRPSSVVHGVSTSIRRT